MEDFNESKKLGKLSEKQYDFIRLFTNGIDVVDIIEELEITENVITNWMITNPASLV